MQPLDYETPKRITFRKKFWTVVAVLVVAALMFAAIGLLGSLVDYDQ